MQDRVVLQTALIKALTQQRSSRTQSSSERMPLNPRVNGWASSAVDCCESSFGTRRADDRLWLGWRRPESSPDKRQHRANLQRGCRCNSSGIRLCSSNSAALPGHSASRRRNEKHRNLALSSPLLHQFTGALPRGRTRARGPSAYAIDATRASSAPSNRHHRRFAHGGRRAVSSST